MFKSFRRCLSVFHRRLFTGFCIICLRLRALAASKIISGNRADSKIKGASKRAKRYFNILRRESVSFVTGLYSVILVHVISI